MECLYVRNVEKFLPRSRSWQTTLRFIWASNMTVGYAKNHSRQRTLWNPTYLKDTKLQINAESVQIYFWKYCDWQYLKCKVFFYIYYTLINHLFPLKSVVLQHRISVAVANSSTLTQFDIIIRTTRINQCYQNQNISKHPAIPECWNASQHYG